MYVSNSHRNALHCTAEQSRADCSRADIRGVERGAECSLSDPAPAAHYHGDPFYRCCPLYLTASHSLSSTCNLFYSCKSHLGIVVRCSETQGRAVNGTYPAVGQINSLVYV